MANVVIHELIKNVSFENLRYRHFCEQIISGRLLDYVVMQKEKGRSHLEENKLSVASALGRELVREIISHDENLRMKALIHDLQTDSRNILRDQPHSTTVRQLLRTSLFNFLMLFGLWCEKEEEITRVIDRYRTTDDFGDADYSKVVKKLIGLVRKSECVEDDEIGDAAGFLFIMGLYVTSSRRFQSQASSGYEEDRNDGSAYELDCLKSLEEQGYEARLTPVNDQGADIIASKGDFSFAIQCKDLGRLVGNKAVQEAASARQFYTADFAVVVSPEGFTMSALELAAKTNVILVRSNQITHILELSKAYS